MNEHDIDKNALRQRITSLEAELVQLRQWFDRQEADREADKCKTCKGGGMIGHINHTDYSDEHDAHECDDCFATGSIAQSAKIDEEIGYATEILNAEIDRLKAALDTMLNEAEKGSFDEWLALRGWSPELNIACAGDVAIMRVAFLAGQANALEAAAKMAEDTNNLDGRGGSTGSAGDTAKRIAEAIRALKRKE